MKTVELTKATKSLSEYARDIGRDSLLVVRNGKPLAMLSSAKGMDAESIALANSPKFARIIKRSREAQERAGGISIEEIRRRFDIKGAKRATRKRAR